MLPALDVEALTQPETLNQQIARAALALFKAQPGAGLLSTVSDEAFSAAVCAGVLARPPCRFELFGVTSGSGGTESGICASKVYPDRDTGNIEQLVLFDIAHNEAAIEAMARKVQLDFADREIRCVLNAALS